jgi:hypothetical protein
MADPFSIIQPLVISRQKFFFEGYFSVRTGFNDTGLNFVSCLELRKRPVRHANTQILSIMDIVNAKIYISIGKQIALNFRLIGSLFR